MCIVKREAAVIKFTQVPVTQFVILSDVLISIAMNCAMSPRCTPTRYTCYRTRSIATRRSIKSEDDEDSISLWRQRATAPHRAARNTSAIILAKKNMFSRRIARSTIRRCLRCVSVDDVAIDIGGSGSGSGSGVSSTIRFDRSITRAYDFVSSNIHYLPMTASESTALTILAKREQLSGEKICRVIDKFHSVARNCTSNVRYYRQPIFPSFIRSEIT